MRGDILRNVRITIVCLMVVVIPGCGLVNKIAGDEMVFAPTEVGTPVGDTATANIGPVGATLEGIMTETPPDSNKTKQQGNSSSTLTEVITVRWMLRRLQSK